MVSIATLAEFRVTTNSTIVFSKVTNLLGLRPIFPQKHISSSQDLHRTICLCVFISYSYCRLDPRAPRPRQQLRPTGYGLDIDNDSLDSMRLFLH